MLTLRWLVALGAALLTLAAGYGAAMILVRIHAEWLTLPERMIIVWPATFALHDPHPVAVTAARVAYTWEVYGMWIHAGVCAAAIWSLLRLMPWQAQITRIRRGDLASRGSAACRGGRALQPGHAVGGLADPRRAPDGRRRHARGHGADTGGHPRAGPRAAADRRTGEGR